MAPRPLTDLETLLWDMEQRNPLLRATITVVALLDASPGIDHLRDRVEVLTAHVPRLRDRIVPGPTPMAKPVWVTDDAYDPTWHVRTVAAPEPSGIDGLFRLVEPLATDGVDRSRPPWQMTLITHVTPGGAAALVIRLHHVLADGVGAVRLASVLFDLSPGAPPLSPPAGRERPPPTRSVTLADLGADLRRSIATAWARVPLLADLAREAWTDPQPRAQATVDMVRSVGRLATPALGPLSPIMVGRSLASRLGTVDLDLAQAAAAGRAAGGTLNDVFVAGLLDGLRRYHDAHGVHPRQLRIGVPVNTRTDEPDDVSNAFAPARMIAPLQMLGARERITSVHRLVLRERHQPAHDVIGPLAGMAHRLRFGGAALGAAMGAFDAMASNVPGPPLPLWLGPARVEAVYPFGPRGGSGLNVTVLSYEGTAHIGVHVDPAATPDPKVLLDCLHEGWATTIEEADHGR